MVYCSNCLRNPKQNVPNSALSPVEAPLTWACRHISLLSWNNCSSAKCDRFVMRQLFSVFPSRCSSPHFVLYKNTVIGGSFDHQHRLYFLNSQKPNNLPSHTHLSNISMDSFTSSLSIPAILSEPSHDSETSTPIDSDNIYNTGLACTIA